ncbi:MAG: EAL domain-containing protein [Myxococcota bacterium]
MGSLHEPRVQTAVPRILYVDDEPGVRAAFARSMGAKGFRVDLAADGSEAMTMATRNVYPVVVTDLAMPGLDGFSMMEQLRSLLPGTIFVIITGQSLADVSPVRVSDESISDIVTKPWDTEDLADSLRDALELHQTRNLSSLPASRVLLVDSAPEWASTVNRYLGDENKFAVERVDTVAAAVRALTEETYQCVLTELAVSDGSGVDILRHLQSAAPDVPVVILTDRPNSVSSAHAIRVGAQDFLAKSELASIPLSRAIRFAIERKCSERRLAHLADHDQLTGLSNRMLFQRQLSQTVARGKRRNDVFPVVLVDIDRFKAINDGLGADGADAVLVEISRRLSTFAESTDAVARLGSDQFAIVCEGVSSPSQCARFAKQIQEALREPIRLEDTEVAITASVGVAIFPDNGDTAADLITSAETALLQAKAEGRNQYRLFGDQMQSDAKEQLRVESQLRRALWRHEFRLHYQPQYELRTGALVGVEALLRWEVDGRLVPPFKFIPSLEDTGLIVPVGAWVLERACADLKQMHETYGPIRMAVNLSARQFEGDGLVQVVLDACEKAGISYDCLELEITESLLMKDVSRTVAILASLKEAGVRIAIDDFGTGYSSLAYLRRFPVDVLKIDRMFVNEMADEGESSLVASIIGLGKTLGLELVAEGVETKEQLVALHDEGCENVQGYFCGRPGTFDPEQRWEPVAIHDYIAELRGERRTIELAETG